MSKYFLDIGWKSIRHAGEELCGDHVDVIDDRNGNMTAVIADGLGSGVRASNLSTLTSKIISTMIAKVFLQKNASVQLLLRFLL